MKTLGLRCGLALTLLALSLAGCGEEPGCVPGASAACACPNGGSGAQLCMPSRSYAACTCEVGEDAGASGDLGGIADVPSGADVPVVGSDNPIAADIPPVQETVGPEGGRVTLGEVRVEIPAGALAMPTAIRVSATSMAAPSGYRAFSPVFRFEPEGTTFAQPVAITLPFEGDARLATVFWSRSAAPGDGYERVGGVPSGGRVTVQVTHFSTGFVADGVDYTEVPDRTCARTRVFNTRYGTATGIPSAVAVFYGVEDCLGRPMPDLAASDFSTVEDGAAVSSEGRLTVLPAPGLQLFVTLSLDLSSSTQSVLPQVIGAARALIDQLSAARVPVQVSVQVFAGDPSPVTWQAPTLDLDAVRTRLDALGSFTPADRSSTNLFGAVVSGVSQLENAEERYEQRNAGGAFARGYLVLFTDGADTAARVERSTALSAARRPRNQVVTVGLRGADFGESARADLRALGGNAYVEVSDLAVLEREFRFLASRIAGQARATYVLGYCSPRRSGTHEVGVRVTGATRSQPGDFTDGSFSATGFGPGCSIEAFDRANRCGEAQCGGLGCGACDDRTDTCDAATRRCVNNCVPARRCGGATFTNALGYAQRCDDSGGVMSCSGTCVDLRRDVANCGACANRCATGAECAEGVCACGGPMGRACSGVCVDAATNANHCGACDNRCPSGASCINGICTCPGRLSACGVACVDVSTSAEHCGACGARCPTGATCIAGACQCPAGATACGAACVDRLSDVAHCGACNNACARGAVCTLGRCDCSGGADRVCDGACTDSQVDPRHCGACGNACPVLCNLGSCATATQMSTENNYTCVRFSNGTLRCLGSGGPYGSVTSLRGVEEISVGGTHGCVRMGDGTVRCWGQNDQGQLGDGTTLSRSTPVVVSGLSGVVQVVAGYGHSCARLADGTVRCWGERVGNGTSTVSRQPVAVPGLSGVAQLSMGGVNVFALLRDGTVRAWGVNSFGQLGDGTTVSRLSPVSVQGLSGVAQIFAGYLHACARTVSGSMYCWGNNFAGQLGDGTTTDRRTPTLVSGLQNVTLIAAGNQNTCARLGNGTVWCWGSNGSGQLGDGTTTSRPVPTLVRDVSGVDELEVANMYVCARWPTGNVRCWGERAHLWQ